MSTEVTWIVVADAARARIFKQAGAGNQLEELHVLTHPESQLHTGDLRTGGKGESLQSSGASTRQSDPQTTTMEKHAEHFAKEIAEYLRLARDKNLYGKLVIVAAPQELGRIRDNLDATTAKFLDKSIDKNWAQHDRAQIEKHLQNHL